MGRSLDGGRSWVGPSVQRRGLIGQVCNGGRTGSAIKRIDYEGDAIEIWFLFQVRVSELFNNSEYL